MRKILILSVSAGTGHMRAAEALREAACGLGDDVVAEHADVMAFATRLFKGVYADLAVTKPGGLGDERHCSISHESAMTPMETLTCELLPPLI